MSNAYKIFLCFANSNGGGHGWLNRLTEEKEGIRAELDNACAKGYCAEPLIEDNVIDKRIFSTFKKNKNEIVIWHFAGHANSEKLFTTNQQSIKRGGLISFLGRQKNLRLVFLNGCSTQRQALEAMSVGIPVVIATSKNIADNIASEFAIQFYSYLMAGDNTIEESFQFASDEIQSKHLNSSNNRGVLWDSETVANKNEFPWKIYGSMSERNWKLNDLSKVLEVQSPYSSLENHFEKLELKLSNLNVVCVYCLNKTDSEIFQKCHEHFNLLNILGSSYKEIALEETDQFVPLRQPEVKKIRDANVVVLLISTDFLHSVYYPEQQNSLYSMLLDKKYNNEGVLIPILAQDYDISTIDLFNDINVYPTNKFALNNSYWGNNINKALSNIIKSMIGYSNNKVFTPETYENTVKQAKIALEKKDIERAMKVLTPFFEKKKEFVVLKRKCEGFLKKINYYSNRESAEVLNEKDEVTMNELIQSLHTILRN